MKTSIALLLLPMILAASAARADQLTDGEAPTAVAAAPAPVPRGTAEDPNIDRAFVLPTAMTQPGGSGTYNNYELLLHGFTYGITDRVQTSVTVLAPIIQGMPFFGIAALKAQVVSTPRFHLAVQGSAALVESTSSASDTSSSDGATMIGAGAFASVCLRDDCSSLVSASVLYQLAFAAGGTGQLVIYGGSIVHSVSPHVKLVGEVTSGTVRDTNSNSFDNLSGALVSYGIRLHNANLATDIGFIKPAVSGGDGGFYLGVPFASISYRWL